MENDSRIFIAGHTGLVGSAIMRNLRNSGYINLITANLSDLDLRIQEETTNFFNQIKPEYVFLAAAKVGGILANSLYPAEFIYDNLMIQCNVIKSAFDAHVKKLLFLGSSCIYPKFATQPIQENTLLSGYLETTNISYAVAKIAGIKMCQSFNQQYKTNYICAMPTNLYGIFDNFDLNSSHVLPALIRKFHEAKICNREYVEIWGTGNPKREFLFVDDLAEACIFLMKFYNSGEIINIGTGTDVSIKELSMLIKDIVEYKGSIRFDNTKPDGTPRKILDVTKLKNLGWCSKTSLENGIKIVYDWFCKYYKGIDDCKKLRSTIYE
jgi:GDP-L-fucose synthase